MEILHKELAITCHPMPQEGQVIYRKVVTDDKYWFIPTNIVDMASRIFCEFRSGKNTGGFGGGSLTLQLEDGTTHKTANGACWHSNPGSLLSNTGINLTEKCLTRCIISLDKEGYIMKDVVYEDENYTLGSYYRGDLLARERNITD